jgi:hypothetical protein
MPDNYIQTVEVGPDGIIWIGTQSGGLVRLDESLLLSVSQAVTSSAVHIYPVPAKQTLNVNTGRNLPSLIEIYDMNGRLIQDIHVSIENNVTQLNVSALNAGAYLVKVVYEKDGYATKKFFIER